LPDIDARKAYIFHGHTISAHCQFRRLTRMLFCKYCAIRFTVTMLPNYTI
jgi:hypothetical protein